MQAVMALARRLLLYNANLTCWLKFILYFFRGPSLIDYFDSLPPVSRALDKPLRMPVVDRYKVNKQLFYTEPCSAVGNVSGYRCESDCRSRGSDFDPGPVLYFRGD